MVPAATNRSYERPPPAAGHDGRARNRRVAASRRCALSALGEADARGAWGLASTCFMNRWHTGGSREHRGAGCYEFRPLIGLFKSYSHEFRIANVSSMRNLSEYGLSLFHGTTEIYDLGASRLSMIRSGIYG